MDDWRAEIVDVIVDCKDPNRLAAFWAEVLGRAIEGSKGPYVWLTRVEGGVGLGFQRVEEPRPAGKNRVHVDIESADVAAAAHRIEALGGRRVGGFEAGGFLVMADPEGNEFCVLPAAGFDFDDDGNTDYVARLGL